MPRDTRIWMTFPIDFPEHPKIRPLSDAAFRAFVEMNGYSRTQDLDGRIPVRVARAKWKPRALKELETNHAERPTLTIDGDDYVIHNYGEHQQTRADREAVTARNSENGRKGGRPAKGKRVETESVSSGVPTKTQSQSQSQESEKDLTDTTHETQVSPVGNARTGGLDGVDDLVLKKARAAGISDLGAVYGLLAKTVPGPLTPSGAVELTLAITARSKDPVVQKVDAYIAVACRNSPDDVRWDYERLDLGVA